MLAARDDFAVFLDGDAFTCQVERLDQLAEAERRGEAAKFAVDNKFNHNFNLGRSFSIMPDSTLKGKRARASYSGIT